MAFTEALLDAGKLSKVALFSGSEAARGVPKMMIKPPKLKTSSVEDFMTICDGSYFSNISVPLVPYGPVKYVGILWMSAMSRKYPNIRFVTMSPGSTSGTEVGKNLASAMKFVFTKIGPKLRSLSHTVS